MLILISTFRKNNLSQFHCFMVRSMYHVVIGYTCTVVSLVVHTRAGNRDAGIILQLYTRYFIMCPFADNFCVPQLMQFFFDMVENTFGKGVRCWLSAFSPFPTMFSKAMINLSLGCEKFGFCSKSSNQIFSCNLYIWCQHTVFILLQT